MSVISINDKVLFAAPENKLSAISKRPVVFYSQREDRSNEFIERNGILTLKANSPATIVLLHGYGHDKNDLGPFSLLFKEYNTFTFDFRAHGESKHEQHSTLGRDEVHDVVGAVEYLKSIPELNRKPIIAFAFSMGAATAIESQAKKKLFDAMFLDAPFSSSEDVVKKGLDSMKFKVLGYEWDIPGRVLLEKHAFNPQVQSFLKWLLKFSPTYNNKVETIVKPISPVESIKSVNIPVYFVVCKKDEKVPVESVRKIYENLNSNYKRLWITNGRRHCDSVFNSPEEYERKINKFIKKFLSGEYKTSMPSKVYND